MLLAAILFILGSLIFIMLIFGGFDWLKKISSEASWKRVQGDSGAKARSDHRNSKPSSTEQVGIKPDSAVVSTKSTSALGGEVDFDRLVSLLLATTNPPSMTSTGLVASPTEKTVVPERSTPTAPEKQETVGEKVAAMSTPSVLNETNALGPRVIVYIQGNVQNSKVLTSGGDITVTFYK